MTQKLPGESNVYFYEPRGVAAVIAPWNFPLAILTGMTAAALVTGNCAVVKPAEQSPVMGALLMEILREAELPPAACQLLQGGGELGAYLVRHAAAHLWRLPDRGGRLKFCARLTIINRARACKASRVRDGRQERHHR